MMVRPGFFETMRQFFHRLHTFGIPYKKSCRRRTQTTYDK